MDQRYFYFMLVMWEKKVYTIMQRTEDFLVLVWSPEKLELHGCVNASKHSL